MTSPCAAVLVIFNTFPCSGITGGVQLDFKGWRSLFQSFPCSGAQIEALRTVMVFTAAVEIVKTINFSYTITRSVCPIYEVHDNLTRTI